MTYPLCRLARGLLSRVDFTIGSLGPLAVGGVFAIPTLLVHFPPMTDLPFHEGIVAGLVHWGNEDLFPKEIYELNLGHPNQLFYFLAYPVALALGTTLAVKIVVAAAQVATAIAAARLARHFQTSWWTCQVVAASTIGWLYFWGLVTNMLGLAIMLLALPRFDRFARVPNWRGAAASSAWVLALYLAHESSLLCTLAAFGIFALLTPFRLRKWLYYVVPVLGAGTIGVTQAVLQWSLKSDVERTTAMEVVFHTPTSRLLNVAQSIGGLHPPPIDWLLMSLMLVPLFIGVFVRIAWRSPNHDAPQVGQLARLRAWLFEHRPVVVAGALFLLYLFFPTQILSATLVHQRFLPPAFALFAIWAIPSHSPHPRGIRLIRLAKVTAALALAGPLLTAWPAFHDAHASYRDLDRLLPKIGTGQAFFVHQLMDEHHSKLFASGTACGHVLAHRGGRCAFDFTQSPISPFHMRTSSMWQNSTHRALVGGNVWPLPEHDFRRFRYMLVWYPYKYAPLVEVAEVALRPTVRLVATEGQWALFESTIIEHDLTSSDTPPKKPLPPTVRNLVREELRRQFPED